MISLKEIGALCGVSESTVSKALKDHPAVSLQTRDLVKRTAREHHYFPNANVQGIQSGRSQCIGVALNNFGDAYSGRILSAAQEVLHDSGYDLIVIPWDLMAGRHEGIFDRFSCRRTDGVLLFPTGEIPDEQTRAQLKSLNGPVVQIDQSWEGESFGYVGSDNHGGGREAIRVLLERGCKRIGIVGLSGISSGAERLEGALAQLQNAGRAPEPGMILELSSDRENDEASYRILCRMLAGKQRPDGLFCFNDRIAGLAVKAAANSGLNVPQQLQIIGFGDLPLGFVCNPSLATFDQQPERIGMLAGRMLRDCIAKKDGARLHRVEVPVNLILRDSIRQPERR